MRRATLLLLFVLCPGALPLSAACPCMIRFGACDEVRQSDAVFIGTVESVVPPFLDPYAKARAMASLPAAETARLQADSSPDALAKLKSIYLQMFAGVSEVAREQIVAAKTPHELEQAFEAIQTEGRFAHFRVSTFYKAPDADDSAPAAKASAASAPGKDDDDAAAAGSGSPGSATPRYLDIWTSSGDCGIDFQVGETYLVYAVEDEDSGKLATSVCMRTRRLSEEQGDLGYLYYLQNDPKQSTRVEGFVSTSFADQNLPRYEDSVSAPSGGALLELDGGSAPRYARSDPEGRFYFDGLGAGSYRLSLLAPGFPRTPRTVILSHGFQAAEASCVRQIVIFPPRPAADLSQ